MADTGAPWNIPYVEPTDLVRDYPAADEAQALAIAAGLSAAGNAGIGSNVVQAVKTDTFSTTSRNVWVDVTDLTVNITPSSATSKVLLLATLNTSSTTGNGETNHVRVAGGDTGSFIGDAASNRTRAVSGMLYGVQYNPSASMLLWSWMYVDSPASAAQQTYKLQVQNNGTGGTLQVNRSNTDTNSATFARGASSLIAIEVAQ